MFVGLSPTKPIKKYDTDFIVMDFAANLDFLYIKYGRAVETGIYSEEAASTEHTHEAVLLIQKEYNFVYDRVKRANDNKKKPFEVPEAPRMPFKHENYPKLLAMWSNEVSNNAKYYDLFIEGFYDEEDDSESEEEEKRVLHQKSEYATSNIVLGAEGGKLASFNFQPAFSDDTYDFIKYELPHSSAGRPVFASGNDINRPTGGVPEREFCKSQHIKSTESPNILAHEQVIRDRIQHIAMDTILITHGHKREDFSRLTNDEEDTPEDYKYYKEYAEYCR